MSISFALALRRSTFVCVVVAILLGSALSSGAAAGSNAALSLRSPRLAAAYKAACPTYGTFRPPVADSGTIPPPFDAGGDAAASDDGGSDAGKIGTDASTAPTSTAWCDDLDVAVEGMPLNDVGLVRLRANLPNAALADTLRLEPSPSQENLDNVHYAKTTGTIPAARVARLHASRSQGTVALIALTAVVVSRLVRRKKAWAYFQSSHTSG